MKNNIITLLACLFISGCGVTGIITDKWVEPSEMSEYREPIIWRNQPTIISYIEVDETDYCLLVSGKTYYTDSLTYIRLNVGDTFKKTSRIFTYDYNNYFLKKR